MNIPIAACAALFAGACATSCLSHEVEVAPIEVKPIHVTVDVNVRVQRELDDFFDYEKKAGENAAPEKPNQENTEKEQPKEGK